MKPGITILFLHVVTSTLMYLVGKDVEYKYYLFIVAVVLSVILVTITENIDNKIN